MSNEYAPIARSDTNKQLLINIIIIYIGQSKLRHTTTVIRKKRPKNLLAKLILLQLCNQKKVKG